MGLGFRTSPIGGVAAPPYTNGPYNFSEHINFSSASFNNNTGNVWFVDSDQGSSTNSGKGWAEALDTITGALALSGPYDTIYVAGSANTGETSDYAESVTIPLANIGTRIIGCGNSPEGVLWTVGTAEGTILTIAAKDCVVSGFRFRPNGATSGKAIDLASTAIGCTIVNNIFRSTTETAAYGIYMESTADVTIANNVFTSVATAIYGNASVKTVYRARILNNLFDDKVDDAGINMSARACLIKGNDFTSDTTLLIDTYKGSAGEMNIVTGNTLMCASAYETNCTGAASDNWLGNFCNDTGSSLVGDNGITIGIPTA